MQEATGSSPVSSTSSTDGATLTIGAHAFRDRFGYWMERAAAGEEILIARHGRRFARFSPADPSLDLAAAGELPP